MKSLACFVACLVGCTGLFLILLSVDQRREATKMARYHWIAGHPEKSATILSLGGRSEIEDYIDAQIQIEKTEKSELSNGH